MVHCYCWSSFKCIIFFCFLLIITDLTSVTNAEDALGLKEPPELSVERNKLLIPASQPEDIALPIELSTQDPSRALVYYTDYHLTNCTSCQIPAGIYFKISQKGIDYITELAAEAIPQLLNNSTLPDVDADGVKILKMRVEKFEKPIIKAHFIEGEGVGADVFLPNVVMSAVCEIRSFVTSQRGKLRAEIRNLSIVMEVHLKRNETAKLNIITTPVCNVTSSKVQLLFAGDMSNLLNVANSMLNKMILSALANPLCEIPITVAQFFEQQKRAILTTTPIPSSTSPTTPKVYVLKFGEGLGSVVAKTTPPPVENENAFYETSEEEPDEDLAAKFAAELCSADTVDEMDETLEMSTLRPVMKRSVTEQPRFNPKLVEALWAPDLTLMYSPNFTKKSVIFGLDGGIVFYGQKAQNVSRPRTLDVSALGDKMFGLLISEYVPNTFLTHVYDNGLGSIHEVFKTHNLPKFIKPIAKVLCSSCELHLFANLTSRPHMTIDNGGVRMAIQGDVSIKFVGRWKSYNLISADTVIDVVVRPFVRYSRVYGDIGLAKLDIQMKNMGLRGMFANSLKKAINAVIPNKLWPKIKKRLRFALSQRGIRLPIMCGVELERPSLEYTDHGIVINTDFSYDLPRFVRKFKAYIKAEIESKKKKINDYDYYDN